MKYVKNTIFIIFTVLLIISVVFFNFWIDPYAVFRNRFDLDITPINRDHYHIILKAYKDFSADTVFLGASSTYYLFCQRKYYRYFFNLLSSEYLSYEQQYYLLKDYLHFHPETKNVYIFITYPSFYEKCAESISKFDGDKLNFKDMMFLLFSAETTKLSINCLKYGKLNMDMEIIIKNFEKMINKKFKTDIKLNSNKHKQEKPSVKDFDFPYFPNNIFYIKGDEKIEKYNKKLNFEYLIKISELLKEKNINTYFVFHPYHAIYQSLLTEGSFLKKQLMN